MDVRVGTAVDARLDRYACREPRHPRLHRRALRLQRRTAVARACVAESNGGPARAPGSSGGCHGEPMITGDQTAVIEFMAAASTYGGANVERLETHASVVFLAGERAYKLKRAVKFDYLDFSTPERRRQMCEAEVRL